MQSNRVFHDGARTLLNLWDQRKERKPYLFGMETDFAKLKAPFIWYDILHVIDVLSQFPWLRDDERLLEMVSIVEAKMDDQARFTPESVWRAWKEWDFGQKKEPSWWVTFLVWRILKRFVEKEAKNLADDPLLKLAGIIKSNLTDISERHDEYFGKESLQS